MWTDFAGPGRGLCLLAHGPDRANAIYKDECQESFHILFGPERNPGGFRSKRLLVPLSPCMIQGTLFHVPIRAGDGRETLSPHPG